MTEEKKHHSADLIGMGNLLEALVAENVITCEEKVRIILRIAERQGFTDCWNGRHTGKHLLHGAKSKMKVMFPLQRRKIKLQIVW